MVFLGAPARVPVGGVDSARFGGAPSLPFNTASGATPPRTAPTDDEISAQLAALARLRRYYQQWLRTREANENMMHAPQGLRAFFRAYCHYKSADWAGNKPFTLKSQTADEIGENADILRNGFWAREWQRQWRQTCLLPCKSLRANGSLRTS
jgi:hypothetical protein